LRSELHALKIDLFLRQQGLDTTTPAGKAMFQMMGVFAEFERAMIAERVRAGLATARSEGTRLGRPPLPCVGETNAAQLSNQTDFSGTPLARRTHCRLHRGKAQMGSRRVLASMIFAALLGVAFPAPHLLADECLLAF
jgi:DNA invertase Pin-like site-specific DNA recombinase